MSRIRKAVIAPIILGVVGVAVLLGLSAWQVQRLAWKEGLITQLAERLSAEPVALPASPSPDQDAFLRVTVNGQLAEGALYRLTTVRPDGPGFQVIVPVQTEGRRVLVDLGYVPEAARGSALPATGTALSLTGALFWPEPDSSAPPPDLAAGIVFSRTPGPLAKALGTEPLLIVADAHSLGASPRAMALGVDLPNNHRNYAITWAGLALVWAVMSILWLRSGLRGPIQSNG
ncbi:MAG: SURF1 family protein [Pseudomonadota bacterium]